MICQRYMLPFSGFSLTMLNQLNSFCNLQYRLDLL